MLVCALSSYHHVSTDGPPSWQTAHRETASLRVFDTHEFESSLSFTSRVYACGRRIVGGILILDEHQGNQACTRVVTSIFWSARRRIRRPIGGVCPRFRSAQSRPPSVRPRSFRSFVTLRSSDAVITSYLDALEGDSVVHLSARGLYRATNRLWSSTSPAILLGNRGPAQALSHRTLHISRTRNTNPSADLLHLFQLRATPSGSASPFRSVSPSAPVRTHPTTISFLPF